MQQQYKIFHLAVLNILAILVLFIFFPRLQHVLLQIM